MEGQIQPGRHHLRGAIADLCLASGKFYADEDSTVAAKFMFRSSRDNMFAFLKASSHRRRLRKLNLNEDVKYCLTPNNCTAIPILKNGSLVRLNHEPLKHSTDFLAGALADPFPAG